MRLLFKAKDGGAESNCTGYWLIECKWLFSIVLLKFDGPSREAFHTHAFDCWNWVLSGELKETQINGNERNFKPSFKPFAIYRGDFHKVDSPGKSWVISLRGPWNSTWREYLTKENRYVTLKSGRLEQYV